MLGLDWFFFGLVLVSDWFFLVEKCLKNLGTFWSYGAAADLAPSPAVLAPGWSPACPSPPPPSSGCSPASPSGQWPNSHPSEWEGESWKSLSRLHFFDQIYNLSGNCFKLSSELQFCEFFFSRAGNWREQFVLCLFLFLFPSHPVFCSENLLLVLSGAFANLYIFLSLSASFWCWCYQYCEVND